MSGRQVIAAVLTLSCLAVPVLAHRVITKGYLHGGQRVAIDGLIQRLVDEIPAPG